MTYKFYRNFLTIFYILFCPLFLLNIFGHKIILLVHNKFLLMALYYTVPAMALSLLYFSVYSYIFGVKGVEAFFGGPVASIIGASIITLISFGPPIAGYFSSHYLQSQPLKLSQLQSIKEKCLNSNDRDWKTLAELYYMETGEPIEYIHENGTKILYSPNESTKKYIQRRQLLKKKATAHKMSVKILIILAVISCICFILFLKYTSKKTQKKGTELFF